MMELVELHPLRNVTIGMAGAGLAIEARKRVSIAVELVANPAIVFMDEPTSGAWCPSALHASLPGLQ